ncbi:MAG TPA: hypothetical protein VHR86_08410 [Armatimonadota bacterium]|nr:hypothetical protein [Armatimonadota bacterium]
MGRQEARGYRLTRAGCPRTAVFRFAVFTFSRLPGHAARGQRHFVLQFLLFQDFPGMLPDDSAISFCSFYFFRIPRACCPTIAPFRFAVFTFSRFPGHAARGHRHFVLQFLLFQDCPGMLPEGSGISFCSFHFYQAICSRQ